MYLHLYTVAVRKVLADFAVFEWWAIAKLKGKGKGKVLSKRGKWVIPSSVRFAVQ